MYVRSDQRGKGLGKALIQELIKNATEKNFHTIIGAIDSDNKGSISLHEKLGFIHSGTMKQAGFKFWRWLDFAFYQLILETPKNPTEE